jgi:hypothetical protein
VSQTRDPKNGMSAGCFWKASGLTPAKSLRAMWQGSVRGAATPQAKNGMSAAPLASHGQ